MLSRVSQCSDKWKWLDDDKHPLKLLANNKVSPLDFAVSDSADGSIRTSPLCEAIPKYITVTVGRNPGGNLMCPSDMATSKQGFFDPEKHCYNNNKWYSKKGEASRTKAHPDCVIFSLKKGCEIVHKRMMRLEASDPRNCAFKEIPPTGTRPTELKRCLALFNCYDPNNTHEDGDDMTSKVFKLTPEILMATIKRHMDSVDYLTDQNGEAFVPPAVAARHLSEDLSKYLEIGDKVIQDKLAAAAICRHGWKKTPQRVFRHPLWAGTCIN